MYKSYRCLRNMIKQRPMKIMCPNKGKCNEKQQSSQ